MKFFIWNLRSKYVYPTKVLVREQRKIMSSIYKGVLYEVVFCYNYVNFNRFSIDAWEWHQILVINYGCKLFQMWDIVYKISKCPMAFGPRRMFFNMIRYFERYYPKISTFMIKGGMGSPNSKILVCYQRWDISIIKNCEILALECFLFEFRVLVPKLWSIKVTKFKKIGCISV